VSESRRLQACRPPESCRKMLGVAEPTIKRRFSNALAILAQSPLYLRTRDARMYKRRIPTLSWIARRKRRRLKPATFDNSTNVIVARRSGTGRNHPISVPLPSISLQTNTRPSIFRQRSVSIV
jgi:hypothetical protein